MTLAPFKCTDNEFKRDLREEEELSRKVNEAPLPKTIGEYKDHPLYALERHLLKFEKIYPPNAPTLGFTKTGEAVYARECVRTLNGRTHWLKEGRTVKVGELPYKVVKARPKWTRTPAGWIRAPDEDLDVNECYWTNCLLYWTPGIWWVANQVVWGPTSSGWDGAQEWVWQCWVVQALDAPSWYCPCPGNNSQVPGQVLILNKKNMIVHASSKPGEQESMLLQLWLAGISREEDVTLSLMAWWSARSLCTFRYHSESIFRKMRTLWERLGPRSRNIRKGVRRKRERNGWVETLNEFRFDLLCFRCLTTGRSLWEAWWSNRKSRSSIWKTEMNTPSSRIAPLHCTS